MDIGSIIGHISRANHAYIASKTIQIIRNMAYAGITALWYVNIFYYSSNKFFFISFFSFFTEIKTNAAAQNNRNMPDTIDQPFAVLVNSQYSVSKAQNHYHKSSSAFTPTNSTQQNSKITEKHATMNGSPFSNHSCQGHSGSHGATE